MIIVVVGPTGVGKTKMGIELAKIFNGEAINADSTQVYKKLDIATAKVTTKEMEGIKHHLIDIKDIKEDYTVFDYQRDGRIVIEDILLRHKVPIIVGGTGLYIKALLYDYQFSNIPTINYDQYSEEELYNKLLSVDPNTDIHKNNRKRIIRALSYYEKTNIPYSEKEKTDTLLYNDVIFIGLTTDRKKLYQIIDHRVNVMVDKGLIEEAKDIYNSKIRTKAVLTPIGYKELFRYFDGDISLTESLELIKRNSRRYAKRQYTWFNNQMKIKWFDVNYQNFDKTVQEVINYVQEKN